MSEIGCATCKHRDLPLVKNKRGKWDVQYPCSKCGLGNRKQFCKYQPRGATT